MPKVVLLRIHDHQHHQMTSEFAQSQGEVDCDGNLSRLRCQQRDENAITIGEYNVVLHTSDWTDKDRSPTCDPKGAED